MEFAVQAVSRFALSYLLTTRNALAPGGILMTIANPGLSLNDLKVDDLSLKARRDAGRSKPMMAFDQSKRDSTVLDSFIEVCHCVPALDLPLWRLIETGIQHALSRSPLLPRPPR